MITSITERPEKWIWTGSGGLPRNGINLLAFSENDQKVYGKLESDPGLERFSLRSVDGFNWDD